MLALAAGLVVLATEAIMAGLLCSNSALAALRISKKADPQ
jgi:hypothetical protein